ncbi:MAG: hypothetical protein Q7V58_09420 [Actinomycetota bacterium]|nr:hypothetical protein [Actinomycetota bacterium]
MDIARIDKATGLVVNIECADQEWLDAHADDPEYTFVPYTPEAPASIGLKHDPVTGFEQIEPTITTTVKELTDAGLDAKTIETLSSP